MSQPSLSVSKNGSQEGEKKTSYVNYEAEPGVTIRLLQNFKPNMDPKKFKHLILNRVAAQKCKRKKLQYTDDLLKKSQELELEVSTLHSLVGKAREQKRYLEIEQNELNECISALRQHFMSIDEEMEANKLEIKRLQKRL